MFKLSMQCINLHIIISYLTQLFYFKECLRSAIASKRNLQRSDQRKLEFMFHNIIKPFVHHLSLSLPFYKAFGFSL